MYQRYHFTANQAKTKRIKQNDVEYLVVPVVALRAGLLNGEQVPPEEVDAFPEAWNGRPVVLGHPRNEDGTAVSANSPEMLAKIGIGNLYAAEAAEGKLKAEMWIDVARAERMGGEAVAALHRLEQGEPTEVSTAYWRDKDGDVARNLRPDHLAILLHEQGACSWRDGCGAPRINQASSYIPPESARNNARKVLRWREEHSDEIRGMTEVGWRRARQLASGDPISLETVKKMAQFARHSKNAEVAPEYKSTPWKDAGYVAWLGWGGTTGIEWAKKISNQEANVENSDQKEMEQTGAKNALQSLAAFFGFRVQEKDLEVQMDELIKQILDNGQFDLNEEELAGLSESVLRKLAAGLTASQEPDEEEDEEMEEMQDKPTSNADPTVNADTGQKEAADPTASAVAGPAANTSVELPAELVQLAEAMEKRGGVEAVLATLDSIQANSAERQAELVAGLVVNDACAFSKEQLSEMPLDHLEALRRSLDPQDYSGQGGGPVVATNEIERLEMPDIFAAPSPNGGE